MKQFILKIYKPHLLLGITLAILVILFVKYRVNTLTLSGNINIESFLVNPISKINSLCSIPYNTPKLQPPAAPPAFNLNLPVPTPGPTSLALTPKTNDKCKLGVNINPPTPAAQQAIGILTATISIDQVKTVEEQLTNIPAFVNILNSTRKEEIIKSIIIVNKLVSDPKITMSQDTIDHIATTIISDINTVDPQIASAMVEHYSGSETLPDTNVFTNVTMPVPDIELKSDAIQIIKSEPVLPLTAVSEQQIAALFKKIKKDIAYDDCIDILTKRNQTN